MCNGCIARALQEQSHDRAMTFARSMDMFRDHIEKGRTVAALNLGDRMLMAVIQILEENTELSAKYIDLLPLDVIEIVGDA